MIGIDQIVTVRKTSLNRSICGSLGGFFCGSLSRSLGRCLCGSPSRSVSRSLGGFFCGSLGYRRLSRNRSCAGDGIDADQISLDMRCVIDGYKTVKIDVSSLHLLRSQRDDACQMLLDSRSVIDRDVAVAVSIAENRLGSCCRLVGSGLVGSPCDGHLSAGLCCTVEVGSVKLQGQSTGFAFCGLDSYIVAVIDCIYFYAVLECCVFTKTEVVCP